MSVWQSEARAFAKQHQCSSWMVHGTGKFTCNVKQELLWLGTTLWVSTLCPPGITTHDRSPRPSPSVFTYSLSVLQAIQDWRWEQPGKGLLMLWENIFLWSSKGTLWWQAFKWTLICEALKTHFCNKQTHCVNPKEEWPPDHTWTAFRMPDF